MTSGLETLGSIDQAVNQIRRDIQDLDREIQAASDSLVRMGQEETTRFRELAELRLDEMTNGQLIAEMDQADRRVGELLHQRGEALDSLQVQIEESHRRQSDLEAEREAQQQRVHAASETLDRGEAATQKRLASEPAYQAQLDKARNADGVAKHAEEKAQLSEKDRAVKGKEFEADSLFTYLWKRGYGTPRYSANPLFRFLDGWVARLCRYVDARPNYTMLLEIPKRLREHADNVRADADLEFAALRELEEKAAAEDGVPALREALAGEQRRAQEIDAAIEKEEARYSELVKQRSEFAGGEDPISRECLDVLVDQFRREPLAQLRREAAQTITAHDNVVVEKLADLQLSKQRLDAQLAQNRDLHLRHLNRLEELEKVRRDFKREHYDGAHSTFSNGALIGAMLNEFLRGMASSGQLWNTIERQHRRRRIEADPTFGSGGFGFPSGGSWSFPIPMPRGGGGISIGGGGGGISGGGRGGGGFRTGGGF
jgi:hypothetical protein